VGKFLKLKNFEKYLRARREEVELCFAEFGKTFQAFDRGVFGSK
jgi:hypothetical protein